MAEVTPGITTNPLEPYNILMAFGLFDYQLIDFILGLVMLACLFADIYPFGSVRSMGQYLFIGQIIIQHNICLVQGLHGLEGY